MFGRTKAMATTPTPPINSPPALPPTNQPDLRTMEEKARRLQHLARQITNARDLDILTNIIDHLPLLVSAFNVLLRVNASHGFVHLLLRARLSTSRHVHLFIDLRRRLPMLWQAMHSANRIVLTPQLLRKVLRRGNPRHEIAVRQALYRVLHEKDHAWMREVCSGCLERTRQTTKNGHHAFCGWCFPVWCASTGRYYFMFTNKTDLHDHSDIFAAQKKVDNLWLGVHSTLVPGFEFKHNLSRHYHLVHYHAAAVAMLASEVHGMSLQALKDATQSPTPEVRLQLAKKLCSYSAKRICRPRPHTSVNDFCNDILAWIRDLYGHDMDVLELYRLSAEEIMDRLEHIEAAKPVTKRLFAMAGAKEMKEMERIEPSTIRHIVARTRFGRPGRKASLLILEQIKQQSAGRSWSLQHLRVKTIVATSMRNRVASLSSALLLDSNINTAVSEACSKLAAKFKGHDWQLWYDIVDKSEGMPAQVDTSHIEACIDRIWANRRLYTAKKLRDLVLHACASTIYYQRLVSPEFLEKAAHFSTRHNYVCYFFSAGDELTHLDNWMVNYGGNVTIYDTESAARMPSRGLKTVLANRIFIYER